jgi:hypothetical protein
MSVGSLAGNVNEIIPPAAHRKRRGNSGMRRNSDDEID